MEFLVIIIFLIVIPIVIFGGIKQELKELDKDENKKEESTSQNKERKNFWDESTKYKCLDGHKVRSKAEREIDNFFYINRICHIYEYQYEHPETKELTVPDFFLPDYNLIIEYFGLDTREYLLKKEHKIQLYQSDNNINFEYLSFENDENIYDKLTVLMKKYNIPLK